MTVILVRSWDCKNPCLGKSLGMCLESYLTWLQTQRQWAPLNLSPAVSESVKPILLHCLHCFVLFWTIIYIFVPSINNWFWRRLIYSGKFDGFKQLFHVETSFQTRRIHIKTQSPLAMHADLGTSWDILSGQEDSRSYGRNIAQRLGKRTDTIK